MNVHRRWKWLALALALLLGLGAAPQPQKSVIYERYDVDIDVQADGSLSVAETYHILFEGEFQTGFAEIPLGYVDDVVDVGVREGAQVFTEGSFGPGTFTLDRESDVIYVEWEYEPTGGTEERIFTVEYRVLGGLRVYPDEDVLSWIAVPEDRSGISVEASRVTVHLPQPVEPATLAFESFGAEVSAETDEGQTVVFESFGPIPDGTSLGIAVRFPHGLTAAMVPDWQRQIDELVAVYRWESLDVDLSIASDGALMVEETQTLAVGEGTIYHGYREISWLHLDRIADVAVWDGERAFEFSTAPCDYCYVVEDDEGWSSWVEFDGSRVVTHEDRVGSTLVEWAFPGLAAGETATFTLRYTVLGAVRVLTDAQEIAWTAVFADRDVDVEAASVFLHLPPGVGGSDVTVEGGAMAVQPDGTFRVTRDAPVPPGETWSVRIRMPVDATTANKSSWQQDLERELEAERAFIKAKRQAEVRRTRWQLALGALGCLLPILGLLGVLVAWYIWGRDRPTPVVLQYLTDPPSDLPPGIVAYLVDEKPTTKGVMADLLNLATLGLVSADLRQSDFAVTLNWTQKVNDGEVVRLPGGGDVALKKHERTLFNALVDTIPQTHQPHPFSKIQPAFTRALPTIYEQMGEAATQYFSTRPDKARRRWNWAGQGVIIVAGVLGLATVCAVSSIGPVVCAPSVGLAVTGLMLMGVSRWMPQRTTLGAEEAELWRAFQRYLKSLKQYADVDKAQEVLDRYFSYAVALDVEQAVLRQAERMGAQVPIWMVPVAVDVRTAATETVRARRLGLPQLHAVTKGLRRQTQPERAESSQAMGARPALAERPAGADFSLDGLSGSLSHSLDRASRSLSSLLQTAVGESEDSPFEVVVRGAGKATKMTWKAGTSTMKILGDILESSSSGGGGGGYSRRSSTFRSRSWSSSSRSSSRSGRSSSRSSRSSGGGGRRGFG